MLCCPVHEAELSHMSRPQVDVAARIVFFMIFTVFSQGRAATLRRMKSNVKQCKVQVNFHFSHDSQHSAGHALRMVLNAVVGLSCMLRGAQQQDICKFGSSIISRKGSASRCLKTVFAAICNQPFKSCTINVKSHEKPYTLFDAVVASLGVRPERAQWRL